MTLPTCPDCAAVLSCNSSGTKRCDDTSCGWTAPRKARR